MPRAGRRLAGLNLAVLLGALLALAACDGAANGPGETVMPEKTIEAVLAAHADTLMSLPGVVGTAQGLCEGKPCIKVYVINITPELEQDIPVVLEGYPVVVEISGEIHALPTE